MNLRQKNKKLKRQLEEARRQLARANAQFEENYRLTKEIKGLLNKHIGDITTLGVYCHTPKYAMVSEEELRQRVVKQMIPELARCITFEENYVARGGVHVADYAIARLCVVKPRNLA